MPEYPAEFLLAALVVTTLASGGLLGLWAATSRWHWFARTMVVLAMLMPLLWRPIFEPFVTLVAEVVTIVVGVMIYRRNWPRWRFSIAEVLMGMVVVSVAAAGMTRAPEMDFFLWRSTIGLGVVAGCSSLIAAWLAMSANWSQVIHRAVAAGLCLLALSLTWSFTEYTALVFDVCERCCGAPFWCYYSLSEFSMSNVAAIFFEGFVDVSLLTVLLGLPLLTWRLRSRLPRVVRGCTLAISVAAIASWPVMVALELLTPIPIPVPTTEDNAYEDLVAIGKRLTVANSSPLGAQFLAIGDDEMGLVRQCLERPIEVTSHYHRESWSIDNRNWEALRVLCDAIAKRGGDAQVLDDRDTALGTTKLLFDLAEKLRDQGIAGDMENWSRMEAQGMLEAYRILPSASANQRQYLRRRIMGGATFQPSMERALHRKCCYEEHATGWGGHLGHFLTRLTDNFQYVPGYRYGFAIRPERVDSYLRYKMLRSLIATDLLLHEHNALHGEWPDGLDDLQSITEECVWLDPFSPHGEALIYRREGENYLLYSRWDDEQDEGGQLKKSVRNSPVGQIVELGGDVSVENLMQATPAELERLAF